MIIRESVLGRAFFWFTSVTFLVFALLCAKFGDVVTSKQWTYLMSVPGHKWFWTAWFGIASAAAIIGLMRKLYRLIAAGLAVVGAGCLLIFAFYLLAPLIDLGLFTLGFVIWFFATALIFAFAAANVTAVKWF